MRTLELDPTMAVTSSHAEIAAFVAGYESVLAGRVEFNVKIDSLAAFLNGVRVACKIDRLLLDTWTAAVVTTEFVPPGLG